MEKLYQIRCPKCNNKTDIYRYGKDAHGHQKYQCKKCRHQWAPEARREIGRPRTKNYPSCPVCGKGHIIKGRTAYGCSLYAGGCTCRLPFEQYPESLTPAQLAEKIKKNG